MIHADLLKWLYDLQARWGAIDTSMLSFTEQLSQPVSDETVMQTLRSAIETALATIAKYRNIFIEDTEDQQALQDAKDFFDDMCDWISKFYANWDHLGLLLGTADRKIAEISDINRLRHDLDDAATTYLGRIEQLIKTTGPAPVPSQPPTPAETVAEAIDSATTYPVLTQEVGYAPSLVAATSAAGAGAGIAIGTTAIKAINDVLGWKLKPDDPKGFVGALNASFSCKEVEGHTECTWTPRTYAVATDLAGGITGAQASIYSRAKEALDLSLPLLDGLYALDPTADKEDVDALKKVARSQMAELVAELGMLGGPRTSRVSQYFNLLLDEDFPMTTSTQVEHDPDEIGGTLGSLRNVLGLNSQTDDFVNSVEDEQDLTNFRILADYMTSLAQSWVNNLGFFMTPPSESTQPFFGTQLVLLSRQLSVIAESVDEVRFAMDSVFVGPAERQTLAIQLAIPGSLESYSMYAEDLLSWVTSFCKEEGPRLIQEGGKYAVGQAFVSQVKNLSNLVTAAVNPANSNDLPRGYFTGRVQAAWNELASQLDSLERLANPVKHEIKATPTKAVMKAIGTAANFDEFKSNLQMMTNPMGIRGNVPKPAGLAFAAGVNAAKRPA